jgi:hypothetical protein
MTGSLGHPAQEGCVQTPLENDEGDRLRRRAAVMRFLSHLRASADERDLMLSVIQAGAVWYDLDARTYRRDLDGRFSLEAWLPGADVTQDPQSLDVEAVLTEDAPTRISSINELEQFGWPTVQGEVVLLPIFASGLLNRLIVLAGQVDRDVEAILVAVCKSAGAVLEQLAERRRQDVRARLVRLTGEMDGAFQSSVQAIASEYMEAAGAAALRVAVTRPGQPTVTVCSTGEGDWAASPLPVLAPGKSEMGAARIAMGFALIKGASGVVELLAIPARPFTPESVQSAQAGLDVLSVWLAGISIGFAKTTGGRTVQAPPAPPFEDAMRDELARAASLSLSGGVIVASVPSAKAPDPKVVSIIIRTVRAELRSVDLLGQLTGGDIAAVLVRTTPDGVARAAERVRERLDALARAHELPPVVLGHVLYQGGHGGSPASLVEKARQQAGLAFS